MSIENAKREAGRYRNPTRKMPSYDEIQLSEEEADALDEIIEKGHARPTVEISNRQKFTKQMIDLTEEYVNLYSDESHLDGYFSSKELRIIADKMDELAEEGNK